MSVIVDPSRIAALSLIPENAPFSAEQRAWLSGFLAALVVPNSATALTGDAPQSETAGDGAHPLASNDDAPWHDPVLAIDARMSLAEGRPLPARLMAAMAQQDCGQCGHSCADYANLIAQGGEARLNLCAPGGKETARMLKQLAAERDGTPIREAEAAPASAPPALAEGSSRENPVEATLVSKRRLSGPESEKETWHIELDTSATGLDYKVGDSLGVFVENDLGLVDQIIATLGHSHLHDVQGRSFRDVLRGERSLSPAPDALFELMSYLCGGAQRERARALARGEDPDGDAAQLDVLAALQKFPGVRPHPEAFVEALEPLQPRLYSISSSPCHSVGRVSLTVDAVRYVVGKRRRLGAGSTHLAERLAYGAPARVYVQRAHGFGLPENPDTPIVMIGPGTGVAPFRAFLQERAATGAKGRNWLFFGHQRMQEDFFYREEFAAMQRSGLLTRLSLAWSRDGSQKFYVQDRMREVGAALWQWIAEGAHIYVCGDARRMARDVEAAFFEIVAQHGARSADDAIHYIQTLKKSGRYQTDVY